MTLVTVKYTDFEIDRLNRLKKYKLTLLKLGTSLIVELNEFTVKQLAKELGCQLEKISVATDRQTLAFENAVEKRLNQVIGEKSLVRNQASSGPVLTSSPKPEISGETKIVEQTVKLSPEISLESVKTVGKMSAQTENTSSKLTFEIPVVDVSSNDALENSIVAILLAKEFNLFSEEKLIYQILVKSKMTNLFMSLSTVQRQEIESFVAFLREAFGDSTGHAAWERYRNIKQGPNESALLLFQRVKNSYYGIRGKPCPEKVPEEDQLEISETFVRAIKNAKVQCLLRQNSDSIKFEKLGLTARNYAKALSVEEVCSVNQIDSRIDKLTEAVQVMTLERSADSRNRDYSRGRDSRYRDISPRDHRSSRYRDSSRGRDSRYERRGSSRGQTPARSRGPDDRAQKKICYRCGGYNHVVAQCYASRSRVDAFRFKVNQCAAESDPEDLYTDS